jgi:uncharacterized protein (DUF2237 family)
MTGSDDNLLRGAVDLHVHPGPSPYPRRIDPIGAAQAAADAGMAAIVLKSHHHDTAVQIEALRAHGLDEVPVEVFGGIVLNSHVGGINPHAVDLSLAMGGRIVWLPTISSRTHMAHAGGHFPTAVVDVLAPDPVEVVTESGELARNVPDVLRIVAEADAVLAAGHLAPAEIVAVFDAAREAGVTRLVVNHPNFIVEATEDDAARMVGLGAVMEHAVSMYDERSRFHAFGFDVLLRWIEAVGVDNTTLASDLGQADNPLPPESLALVAEALVERGVSRDDVRSLLVTNPARVLGLERGGVPS